MELSFDDLADPVLTDVQRWILAHPESRVGSPRGVGFRTDPTHSGARTVLLDAHRALLAHSTNF